MPRFRVASTSWATHLVALFQVSKSFWSGPSTGVVVIPYAVVGALPLPKLRLAWLATSFNAHTTHA